MTTFYRKERTDIFNRRFSVPSRLSNAWTLKSRTVFEAKQKIKAVTVLKKKLLVTFKEPIYYCKAFQGLSLF